MADPYALDPEDVLEPDAVDEYERIQGVVRDDLIRLHTNLEMLNQMREFRWDLFQGPTGFFQMIRGTLVNHSIVIAYRAWSDYGRGGDNITLQNLRNLVMTSIREEYREAVQDRLREVEPGPRLERVVEGMETIRNRRVGHAGEDWHFDEETRREATVTLNELEELWRRLGEFYNALNFGAQQMFVTIELYAGDDGTGGDLGYLLQLVAENSNVVAFFDEDPEIWRRLFGEKLSEDDLREVNRVRERANLEPIPLAFLASD